MMFRVEEGILEQSLGILICLIFVFMFKPTLTYFKLLTHKYSTQNVNIYHTCVCPRILMTVLFISNKNMKHW